MDNGSTTFNRRVLKNQEFELIELCSVGDQGHHE